MDLYLLGEDTSEFMKPSEFQNLNTAEKIFATSVNGERTAFGSLAGLAMSLTHRVRQSRHDGLINNPIGEGIPPAQ